VEIGGFLGKIYDSKYETYTQVMCLPGPDYEKQLAGHTQWHLFLMRQSPLVRLVDVEAHPLESNYHRIRARIQNEGNLPTYVTQHALEAGLAKTVKAAITLEGAELISGREQVDLGHLDGRTSRVGSTFGEVEWVVEAMGKDAAVTVEAVSQKGGRDRKRIALKSTQELEHSSTRE